MQFQFLYNCIYVNLLTRPMYLPCIKVYSENKVCLRFISMEWNLFPSDGQLKNASVG